MAKYHINDQGDPGACSAKIQCPFGGDAQHYPTPEIAQKAFELSMAASNIPKVSKKISPVPEPTSGSYETGSKAERYIHPQGKIVEINPDGSVTAWKNGKIIPTSATAEKLRAGHGAWKLSTEGSGEVKPQPAKISGKPSPVSDKVMTPAEKNEKERIDELVNKGYPKTSGLDPRNTPRMENRAPETDAYTKYAGTWKGRAVLPTETRVNPHSAPESNEYIQGWAKGGDQSMIAIVKQRGGTRDVYRALLSGHNGESSDIIGDSFPMAHDQTDAVIGNGNWTVVGVFEPIPDGAVIGEIPNQKIPFYVYK